MRQNFIPEQVWLTPIVFHMFLIADLCSQYIKNNEHGSQFLLYTLVKQMMIAGDSIC